MAEVKWIKIVTDIFDDEKIKYIETMPNGDTIIVIWFRLLCLAGKSNANGLLMMTDRLAYTDEMLASVFNRDIKVIKFAIITYEKLGMVELMDNRFYLTNWEKHQNAEKLELIKEQTRARVARHREKLKIGNANSVTEPLQERDCNATDINLLSSSDSSLVLNDIYKDVIDYLNLKAGKNFKLVESNKKHINARIKEGFTLDDFKKVIDNKVTEWKNDDKMNQYLRPETLFSSKFQSYLNSEPKQNFNGKRKENVTVYPTQEVEDVDYDQIAQQFANLSGL